MSSQSWSNRAMNIEVELAGDATVVRLRGDLDGFTAQRLRKELDDILSSAPSRVVFVLDRVEFLGTAGIGALVRCVQATKGHGGVVCLAGLRPGVREVLALANILSLFELYDTEKEALSA